MTPEEFDAQIDAGMNPGWRQPDPDPAPHDRVGTTPYEDIRWFEIVLDQTLVENWPGDVPTVKVRIEPTPEGSAGWTTIHPDGSTTHEWVEPESDTDCTDDCPDDCWADHQGEE